MVNMDNLKSTLLSTMYEWCISNNLVPYVAIRFSEEIEILRPYMNDHVVVLNLGASSTINLTIDDDYITFDTRFDMVAMTLHIPVKDILRMYPREHPTKGIAFFVEIPITGETDKDLNKNNTVTIEEDDKTKKSLPFLKVIK